MTRGALGLFVCAVVVFTCHLSPVAAQSEDAAKGAALLAEAREIFLEPPDKFRRNESLGIGLGGPGIERVEILNGTELIDENSGGGRGGFARGGRGQIDPERLKEAQRRTRQTEVSRLLVAMLLNTTAPVAWIGTAQSPDGTADVLEITIEGNPTRVFLDSSTHMPLMLTWSGGGGRAFARGGQQGQAAQGQSPQGQAAPTAPAGRTPVTQEMHLSDYKVVGGLKLPHLITRGVGGETSEEWTIKSYKINPNFKANTFTK